MKENYMENQAFIIDLRTDDEIDLQVFGALLRHKI